jgi:two-component system nitrate/nitrite response regulator NarL
MTLPVKVVKVVVVAEYSFCRVCLMNLLRERGHIKICAATGDTNQVADLLREHQPDLVVMDLGMSSENALTVLGRLRAANINTPALIFTISDAQEDLIAALRLGVTGYLLKSMEPEDVISAIDLAAHGELVVAPPLMPKLQQTLNGKYPGADPHPLAHLTKREREIINHLSHGESNKVIGRALGSSHDTVKLHVRHILEKLNLSSRVEAAVLAVQTREATRKKNT